LRSKSVSLQIRTDGDLYAWHIFVDGRLVFQQHQQFVVEQKRDGVLSVLKEYVRRGTFARLRSLGGLVPGSVLMTILAEES
jgi:hypothetical protein